MRNKDMSGEICNIWSLDSYTDAALLIKKEKKENEISFCADYWDYSVD